MSASTALALSYAGLLNAAARRLAAAGVADPQRDARWLLRAAAEVDAARLALMLEEPPSPDVAARYEKMVDERAARRPVSHIIAAREFFGRRFICDGRALDPRPESETLVETALRATPPQRPVQVLDLGVGSGCLLLSVLAERALATGVGVDQSDEALALAAQNCAQLDQCEEVAAPIAPRLSLRSGDWLSGLDARFDLILCNPPYIPLAEWSALEPEVRLYEPKAALTPGEDGLAVYRALAPRIASQLAPDGVGLFEVGYDQADDVAALFRSAGLSTEQVKDLGGVARVVAVRRLFKG